MSADNWAVCPRCKKQHETAITQADTAAAAAYGSVPVAEFDALRAAADAMRNQYPDKLFREDYEIGGAEDGVVKVSYAGSCKKCTLSLSFEIERVLDV